MLTNELRRTLYDESQGIVDIAVKLFSLAQSRAIETGIEFITPEAIRKVGNEDLKLVQPMLKALKSGLESEITKYEDITPMDLKGFLEQRKSKIDIRATRQKQKEKQQKQKEQFEISQMENAISALVSLGTQPKLAEDVVRRVLRENKLDSSTEILLFALKIIDDKKANQKEKHKSKEIVKSVNKLAGVIEKGTKEKKSPHEALKEEGYIKLPLKEFII